LKVVAKPPVVDNTPLSEVLDRTVLFDLGLPLAVHLKPVKTKTI
jgi:hypothetical protein